MKTKKVLLGFMIIFLISLTTMLLFAQEQAEVDKGKDTGIAEPEVSREKEEKGESIVELTSDQVSYDKENDSMVFSGNVVIIQEDATLTADLASFNVGTKIGQISGNVKLVKEDITITGEKLEAFLNDKKYIFENQVELVQEREDRGKSDIIILDAKFHLSQKI